MADEKNTPTPETENTEPNGQANAEANTEANGETEETIDAVADVEATQAEVAEDLGAAAVKGPALDQDEGSIQSDPTRGSRKERVGVVVSDKAEKTVTVSVETLVRHKMYKKRVRRSKKFLVHDEANEAQAGDTVRIIETRPLSARKRWRLANVISRAE
jgi:small subunit ribosomal protein S17